MSRECWVFFYEQRLGSTDSRWIDNSTIYPSKDWALRIIDELRDHPHYRNISDPIHVKEASDE